MEWSEKCGGKDVERKKLWKEDEINTFEKLMNMKSEGKATVMCVCGNDGW